MTDALRRALRFTLQEEAGGDKAGAGAGGDKGGEKKAEAGGESDLGTVEDRARRMGWTPAEEFRGDKTKWIDAQTFVKNGEESLPILRERLRTMERTNVELSKSVSEFKKMSDTAFDRAYDKAKKELKAEIKEAGKAGDDKAVEAATEDLAKLEREKAERAAAGEKDPVFESWQGENDWYKDPELRDEAEAIAFKLRKRMSDGREKAIEGLPFLERVKDEMKKAFPEKFGNPRRQGAGAVERSSVGGDGGGGGKKGWEHLPAEAKEAGERYIKQKLYKDKAEYAAAYHAQN